MQVRKDFAKRAKAIADATPREAIANLLRSMLPREPVRTRSPEAMVAVGIRPDGTPRFAPGEHTPLRLAGVGRRRKLRDRSYTVIDSRNRARYGTKRHSQLQIVLDNTSTRAAMLAGAEGVDIAFAESEGYIKFND